MELQLPDATPSLCSDQMMTKIYFKLIFYTTFYYVSKLGNNKAMHTKFVPTKCFIGNHGNIG